MSEKVEPTVVNELVSNWKIRQKAENKARREEGPFFESYEIREKFNGYDFDDKKSANYRQVEVRFFFEAEGKKQVERIRKLSEVFANQFLSLCRWEKEYEKQLKDK